MFRHKLPKCPHCGKEHANEIEGHSCIMKQRPWNGWGMYFYSLLPEREKEHIRRGARKWSKKMREQKKKE